MAAFVTACGDAVPETSELRRWVRGHLADYAAPRWVHVVDELPRNVTGKVVKAELRRWAAELAGRAPAPEGSAG